MIGANLVRGAALLVAAAAAAAEAPAAVVYATSAVITVAATASTRQRRLSCPSWRAPPEELTAANAVSGTLANAAGLAGPALAGILYVATGAGVVFAVSAATFLSRSRCSSGCQSAATGGPVPPRSPRAC